MAAASVMENVLNSAPDLCGRARRDKRHLHGSAVAAARRRHKLVNFLAFRGAFAYMPPVPEHPATLSRMPA